MKTKTKKLIFLKESYQTTRDLFILNKKKQIENIKKTTISYFLSQEINKTLSGIFYSEKPITCGGKRLIFRQNNENEVLDYETVLEELFKSITLNNGLKELNNICLRFKVEKINKNFYLINNKGSFSLSWGINQKNVKKYEKNKWTRVILSKR